MHRYFEIAEKENETKYQSIDRFLLQIEINFNTFSHIKKHNVCLDVTIHSLDIKSYNERQQQQEQEKNKYICILQMA